MPTRSITPNNRSLTYLQTGPFDPLHCHVPLTRGPFQVFLLPAPICCIMWNLYHWTSWCVTAVRSWPTVAREELLAVAHRDMVVARRNVADLTRYLDLHSAHIAPGCWRIRCL